ncbi:MAG: hypothetical protein ACYCW6_29615 [Candidatus Xenobia bacterium]
MAVVPPGGADAALAAWQSLPAGREAALSGTVEPANGGLVRLTTQFGDTRIVDLLDGDPLLRNVLR